MPKRKESNEPFTAVVKVTAEINQWLQRYAAIYEPESKANKRPPAEKTLVVKVTAEINQWLQRYIDVYRKKHQIKIWKSQSAWMPPASRTDVKKVTILVKIMGLGLPKLREFVEKHEGRFLSFNSFTKAEIALELLQMGLPMFKELVQGMEAENAQKAEAKAETII